jgi:hypothetical protein
VDEELFLQAHGTVAGENDSVTRFTHRRVILNHVVHHGTASPRLAVHVERHPQVVASGEQARQVLRIVIADLLDANELVTPRRISRCLLGDNLRIAVRAARKDAIRNPAGIT